MILSEVEECLSDGTFTSASSVEARTGPPVLIVDECASVLCVGRKAAYAPIARGELPREGRIGRAIRVHAPTATSGSLIAIAGRR